MIKGFKDDIEELTLENSDFIRVIYTSKNFQLVVTSLKPKEETGVKENENADQYFRFKEGHGCVEIDGLRYIVNDGNAVIVTQGSKYNITNISEVDDLKFYKIYAPPSFKDGLVRQTKKEADKNMPEFDGKTTE